MANQENTKRAHIPCLCDVAPGQEYCSEACREAGSEEVEVVSVATCLVAARQSIFEHRLARIRGTRASSGPGVLRNETLLAS